MRIERELALDQRGSLSLDLRVARGGPLAKPLAQLLQLAMLPGDSLAKVNQFIAPVVELLFFQLVLLGQLQSQLGNRLRDRRGSQIADDLRPKLLGQQAHLQRLAVQTQRFIANLIEPGFLALDPLLPRLQPFSSIGQLTFRRRFQLFNGQPLRHLLFFPFLSVSLERGAIAIQLLGVLSEQQLRGPQLLKHLLPLIVEFPLTLPLLFQELRLLALALLLPKLLRMAKRSDLAVEFKTPLTQLILAKMKMVFALL